jgi:hypothetical protein
MVGAVAGPQARETAHPVKMARFPARITHQRVHFFIDIPEYHLILPLLYRIRSVRALARAAGYDRCFLE